MRYFLKLILFLISIGYSISPSESADILGVGKREVGFFQPLRWACSDRLECSTHPILMFVIPNFSVKIKHDKYHLTSIHNIFWPTPLLRLLQKEGMFGIVTPYADVGKIPHIVGIHNELLKSVAISKALITFKGGFGFAIVTEELDRRLTIDLPIVYPAMGSFFNKYKFNLGFDFRYYATNKFSLLIDGDAILIPSENIFLHSKLIGEYNFNESWQLLLGSKITSGSYPFGDQIRLLPLFDIVYSWD